MLLLATIPGSKFDTVIKCISLNFKLKPEGGWWPFEPTDVTQPFLSTTPELESRCALDDSRSVATCNGGLYVKGSCKITCFSLVNCNETFFSWATST